MCPQPSTVSCRLMGGGKVGHRDTVASLLAISLDRGLGNAEFLTDCTVGHSLRMKCSGFVPHLATFLFRYLLEVCGFSGMAERDEPQKIVRFFNGAHNHVTAAILEVAVPYLELLVIPQVLIFRALADGKHAVKEVVEFLASCKIVLRYRHIQLSLGCVRQYQD